MLQVAIVEDEDSQAKWIETGLKQYFGKTGVDYTSVRYIHGMDFIQAYKKPFDIVLMDIEMPVMNGLETAEALRKMDDTAVLIFITRMGQYAIRGYEVKAVGYMLKPVTDYALELNLARAMKEIASRQTEKIILQTKGGVTAFPASELIYTEVRGHKLIYHTKEQAYEIYGKLTDEEERLKEDYFARCSNSYLVNLAAVRSVNGNLVYLVSGERLPVSRGMKKSFLEHYLNYLGR